MINVAIFADEYDTGGQGYRIKRAFDCYHATEFNVRAIHTQATYFRWPADVPTSARSVAKQIMAEADVIHVRNTFNGLGHYEIKPTARFVIHYHGTLFRQYHGRYAANALSYGARQMASTIDLTLLEPNVEWLPSPFDLRALAAVAFSASEREEPRKFRIAHAPTNRTVKSTDLLMRAVLALNERGIPTELDLIERRTNAVCLERKAKADVYFDQLILGQGNNALEAYGLRIPVIAGVEDPAVRQAMINRWGHLPFYEATEATLVDRLAELATDSDLRRHWAEIGHDYLSRFHDERIVSEQLAQAYREVMERAA